jgi:hypothetical protein
MAGWTGDLERIAWSWISVRVDEVDTCIHRRSTGFFSQTSYIKGLQAIICMMKLMKQLQQGCRMALTMTKLALGLLRLLQKLCSHDLISDY